MWQQTAAYHGRLFTWVANTAGDDIQPVSFFGDGPRVPMIVVSPYAKRDVVDHTYNDHVSVLKFIEANWRLSPLSAVSEDNLPNATPGAYVPRNSPAIGNLMTMFDFGHPHFATLHLAG
jgi:phospholipase C